MESLLVGLAALACPIGMGVMMWVMGKGMRKAGGAHEAQTPPSVEALREEHRRLGEQIDRMERGDREPSRS